MVAEDETPPGPGGEARGEAEATPSRARAAEDEATLPLLPAPEDEVTLALLRSNSMKLRLPGFSANPISFRASYWNLRRTMRLLWAFVIISVLVTLTVLALVLGGNRKWVNNQEPTVVAFVLASIFTMLTVPIAIYGIHMHLHNWTKPHIQRHIVRVLWMVPIYALNSWLAMALGAACENERWFYIPDAFRSCYESYTIYSFYRFLVALLEDREGMPIEDVMATLPPMKHVIPLRLAVWAPGLGWREAYTARPWSMGPEFLRKCEYGILGYVVEKPLSTLVTVVTLFTHTYGEGQYSPKVAYPYILLLDTFFQCWALYCIVLVYLSTHDVLAGCRPTHKFMCVKGVVFATFWQGLLLSFFSSWGALQVLNTAWSSSYCSENRPTWADEDNIAALVVDTLQNVLITLEMLIFSILHAFSFPSLEFRDASVPKASVARRILNMLDVSDVYADVSTRVIEAEQGIAETVSTVARDTIRAARGSVSALASGMGGLASPAGRKRRGKALVAEGLAGGEGGEGGGETDLRQPLLEEPAGVDEEAVPPEAEAPAEPAAGEVEGWK